MCQACVLQKKKQKYFIWMPHYNPLSLKLTNIVRKEVHFAPNGFYDLQDSQNVRIENETVLMKLIFKEHDL
jgi:hypothetical protein